MGAWRLYADRSDDFSSVPNGKRKTTTSLIDSLSKIGLAIHLEFCSQWVSSIDLIIINFIKFIISLLFIIIIIYY